MAGGDLVAVRRVDAPPAQVGVFTDGDGVTAITRWTGDVSELVYLEAVTAALP